MNTATHSSKASFSLASIIAIVEAIASFFVGALGGLFLALIAIVAGIIGVGLALAPSRRGGFASGLAVVGGLMGIGIAVIKAILSIF